MNIILFNPEVTQGTKLHSICGRSGKVYGKTSYSSKYQGHIFTMTMTEYRKHARDILSNRMPLQLWIPIPEEPEAKPEDTTLADILETLLPFAKGGDKTPVDTLRRILAPEIAKAEAVSEIALYSTQKLRAVAAERMIDVTGLSRPEMIAKLTS